MHEDKIAKNLLLEQKCENCSLYYTGGRCKGLITDQTCENWKRMSRSAKIMKDAAGWLKHQEDISRRSKEYAQIGKIMKEAVDIVGKEFTQ
jgi:hypothetical protein